MINKKRDIESISNEYKSKYPQFSSQIEDFKCALVQNEELSNNAWFILSFEKSLKKAMESEKPAEALVKASTALASIPEIINGPFSRTFLVTIVCIITMLFIGFFALNHTILSKDVAYYAIGIVMGAAAFLGRNVQLSKNQFLCALVVAGMGIYDAVGELTNGVSPSLIVYLCGMIILLAVSLRQSSTTKK